MECKYNLMECKYNLMEVKELKKLLIPGMERN